MLDYKNSEMRNTIAEYVRNSKYRDVLCLRFCEGQTYEEISEATQYSPQHVKHICRTYKELLLSHL